MRWYPAQDVVQRENPAASLPDVSFKTHETAWLRSLIAGLNGRWLLLTYLFIFTVQGCSDVKRADKEPVRVEISGNVYLIPADKISAAANTNGVYLRVKLPEEGMMLVIDEWKHNIASFHGPDVPVVSGVSDKSTIEITTTHLDGETVVCGRPAPHYDCGFRVNDGAAAWSVLFDRAHKDRVRQIKATALQAINGFRTVKDEASP
jgi:hypothetical protein